MRHRNKINHLGRDTQHRDALLSNLAISLIEHKHIITTTAKAKALRLYIDPILTRSKENSTHNRRIIFSMLENKKALAELFDQVGPKIATRPGGYTRIIKIGPRAGDAAQMALIEMVDYSLLNGEAGEQKVAKAEAPKKRTRRAGKKPVVKKEEAKG